MVMWFLTLLFSILQIKEGEFLEQNNKNSWRWGAIFTKIDPETHTIKFPRLRRITSIISSIT